LGKDKPVDLVIKRDSFTGDFYYLENGEKHQIKSPLDPTTHFSFKLKKTYEFEVGTSEKYKIVIEHIRPIAFAGFRPQTFKIYANGKLLETYKGH